ncbi:unnamed protein product [Closterium sp. NIES-54]
MNSTIKPIGPSEIDARGVVVNPESRHMWISFMSAFGKDMSAAAVVVRLRLSLRPNRKWRTLRVFLERFKAVGVGGGNSLIQGTIALNRFSAVPLLSFPSLSFNPPPPSTPQAWQEHHNSIKPLFFLSCHSRTPLVQPRQGHRSSINLSSFSLAIPSRPSPGTARAS